MPDFDGNRPLQLISKEHIEHIAIVKLLLNKADPDLTDRNGKSARDYLVTTLGLLSLINTRKIK